MENLARKIENANLSVDTKQLKEAVAYLKSVANEKSLGVLSIKAENGKLTLAAMNLTLAAQITLDCWGDMPPTVFAMSPTYNAIRSMPGKLVSFDGQQFISDSLAIAATVIDCESFRFLPATYGDWQGGMTVTASDAKQWAKELLAVVQKNSARNYGSVVFMGNNQLVGTDGFRLTYINRDLPDELSNVCLNHASFKAIAGLKDTSHWSISEDKTTMRVATVNTELHIRTSAVKYPNYTGLLRNDSAFLEIPLCVIQLKALLTTADKSQAIKIEADNGTMTFKTLASAFTLPVTNRPMPARGINGKYLLDTLKNAKAEYFRIEFSGVEDPLTVKLPSHTTLIVPIQEKK